MFSGGVLNREPPIFRGLSAYDCARQTLKSSFDVILQKNLPGRQEKVGSFDDIREGLTIHFLLITLIS